MCCGPEWLGEALCQAAQMKSGEGRPGWELTRGVLAEAEDLADTIKSHEVRKEMAVFL